MTATPQTSDLALFSTMRKEMDLLRYELAKLTQEKKSLRCLLDASLDVASVAIAFADRTSPKKADELEQMILMIKKDIDALDDKGTFMEMNRVP
jgi:hypothetical protein